MNRTVAATEMGFRDQARRPLLLLLLVIVPTYTITRSITITLPTPRQIGLPGGSVIDTTMRAIHGALMADIAIAFVAALCGVFVMGSALSGDRRLVIAGYRPGEAVAARLAVLATATALVVTVSMLVTAFSFTPASWPTFIAGAALTGLMYASIGALVGAIFDKLGATYLILFLAFTDLGIVQNPMFGDGTPDGWASLLPGYGPARVMVDGSFSESFHATGDLWLSLGWVLAIGVCVGVVLRRQVRPR